MVLRLAVFLGVFLDLSAYLHLVSLAHLRGSSRIVQVQFRGTFHFVELSFRIELSVVCCIRKLSIPTTLNI